MHTKPLVWAIRASDELRSGAPGYVNLEDGVGVVQIRYNQVELREIIHQVRFELTSAREKASQAPGFDRLCPVSQTGFDG
jgi:hypothetical protein